MTMQRRRHSAEFKAKVALEAIKGIRSLGQLSATYGVHSAVLVQWKRQLVERAAEVFTRNGSGSGKSQEELTAPLCTKRLGG